MEEIKNADQSFCFVLLPVRQLLPRHRGLCHFLGSSCGEPRQTDSSQSAEECAVVISSDAKVDSAGISEHY